MDIEERDNYAHSKGGCTWIAVDGCWSYLVPTAYAVWGSRMWFEVDLASYFGKGCFGDKGSGSFGGASLIFFVMFSGVAGTPESGSLGFHQAWRPFGVAGRELKMT